MTTRAPGPDRGDKESHVSVRAELDLGSETKRLRRVLFLWLVCLGLAIGVAASLGRRDEAEGDARASFLLIVVTAFALLVPGAVSLISARRRRRGGLHARGIVVEVTSDGLLRVVGRGYRVEVRLGCARVEERVVGLDAGRRAIVAQRRLRVASSTDDQASVLELATPATVDEFDTAPVPHAVDGDCVELSREDYGRVRAALAVHRTGDPAGDQAGV